LIIATYRPSDLLLTKHAFFPVKLELQGRSRCRDLSLGFLSCVEVERYLALNFPEHQFPAELPSLIHTKTEGNPLFMVELVRYLGDRKWIPEDKGKWLLAQSVAEIEAELPESIRSLIERKLDQIGDSDRRLLLTASVAGYEFDSAVLSKALAVEAAEVEDRLEQLDRIHGLVRFIAEREFPDGSLTLRYRFVHVLYQNTFYASLKMTRRVQLSEAVARALLDCYKEQAVEIASTLAVLFEAARDFDRATGFFLQAAQKAAAVFANQEAAALARHGLELLRLLPGSPDHAQRELLLQLTLGFSLAATDGWSSSEMGMSMTRARELCQQMGDIPQLFPATFGLCGHYVIAGELDTAQELGDQLIRIAQNEQDLALLAGAHFAFGSVLQYRGELVLGQGHLEQAISFHDPQQQAIYRSIYRLDPGVYSRGDSARALWLLGYPDKSLYRIKEALLLANTAEPRTQSYIQAVAAMVHHYRRDVGETLRWSEIAIKHCQEHGIREIQTWATIWQGWAKSQQGAVTEGIALIRAALSIFRARGTGHAFPHHSGLLAEALGKVGQMQEALIALSEAFDVLHRNDEHAFEAELFRLKGELLLTDESQISQVEATNCFCQSLEIARRQAAKSWELRAVTSLSRLWCQQGRRVEARQKLAEVYNWFTEGFDTQDLKDAKALLEALS